VHPPSGQFDEEQHLQPPQPDGVDQPAVPAQQRLGLDEEARPAAAGSDLAERGEQGAVGGLKPGPCDTAAQHGELVAQHQDLQVLGGVATGEQDEQLLPAGTAE
jgi:hypothetical protein